jgi:hypothetical protein
MNPQELNDEELSTVLKAESILAAIKNDDHIVLFHSGTADNDEYLKYGVEGRFGEWLEQCLSGATDDDDLAEEIRNEHEIAFFSEEPSWIKAKVSQRLGTSVGRVSYEQIEEYGQLCILSVSPDDMHFKRAGYRDAADYDGRSHHLNGELADYSVPFGVEQGDIYSSASTNSVEITLTGRSLIAFIERNYPEFGFQDLKEKMEVEKEPNKIQKPKIN